MVFPRRWRAAWLNCPFQTKLAAFLILGAVLPTGLVSYSLIRLAEAQLLDKVQRSLQKDLAFFQQQQHQLQQNHGLLALSLAKEVTRAKIDLSQPNPTRSQQTELNALLQQSIQAESKPSFYLLTDARGRTIAQHVQVLAGSPTAHETLPSTRSLSATPTYRPVTMPVGIDLSHLTIAQTALKTQKTLAGHEIVPPEVLRQLGLAEQATIGIQAQKMDGLPQAKQPLPIGTYPLQQGQIGLVVMAVQPIRHNNRLVGLAIVGTLLNRNPAFVDTMQQQTGVSTATLFAYDWRVSTNVPTVDGTKRAIGTRVAREVAETTLQQRKPFLGMTNIVGDPYLTAYTPLYDHRYVLEPAQAEPIGILYVGSPLTKVNQAIAQMLWVGYGIGGATLGAIGLLAFPLASVLSRSLQRLTEFAQQVGRSQTGGVDGSLLTQFQTRQDEVGILARELSQMNQRIELNLTAVKESEQHQREQAVRLQDALHQLQQAQLQLIQTEKMSGLGQLTAGIAHEINNPINFIHGNLNHAIAYIKDVFQVLHLYRQEYPRPSAEVEQAIAQADLDFVEVDLPKLLTSMEMGTRRIRDIVLSLRSFSRLDEAERKVVNLHAGLDSALLMVQHRLQSSKIEVVKQYGDMPDLNCYAGLLNQVFMNIFNNAIDALEERFKSIDSSMDQNELPYIAIATHFDGLNELVIKIADNGIGISEAAIAKIFDPFYTTKPVGKGTGLGLSMSYQIIVEKHAGELTCKAEPGQGAEFQIKLPYRELK
jgi:signal transduction histidine kinase